ncbi:peptidoglycan-binding domain-containing protein [Arcanobacterium canis]
MGKEYFPQAIRDLVTGRLPYRIRPRGMSIHTAVSGSNDIYGPNPGPGGTYAHFYNPMGPVPLRQACEINRQAAADLKGNPFLVSVENSDGYPNRAPGYWKNGSDIPPFDAYQIEKLAQLFAYLVAKWGIPNRIATPDRPLDGLTWHRMGIVGNFGKFDPKNRLTWSAAQSGWRFSNARGKTCPGDRRIMQIPAIFNRAQQILATDYHHPRAIDHPVEKPGAHEAPKPPTAPRIAPRKVPYYTRAIDGVRGAYQKTAEHLFLSDRALYRWPKTGQETATWAGWQKYLSWGKFYTREVDGQPGYYTIAGLQKFLTEKGYYNRAIDGDYGPYTIKAHQTLLAKSFRL